MQIWVDADACPGVIKNILFKASERTGLALTLVANHPMRIPPMQQIKLLQVPSGFDVADNEIVKRLETGDLVITNDIPLAARCVEAGAKVLKPNGEALTAVNIGNVLAMRDLAADLRAADPFRQGGGKGFSKADRSRFLDALDRALR